MYGYFNITPVDARIPDSVQDYMEGLKSCQC